MEAMLVTPIGIVSFAAVLALGLVTLVKSKRRCNLIEARLNRGLHQFVGTSEPTEGQTVPCAEPVL